MWSQIWRQQLRADLARLIDGFDRVVSMAAGVVDEELMKRLAGTARTTRDRRGFLGRTLLVAFAGGTGSGKSSLLNALAGEEIVEVGPRRPTTHSPVAWVSAEAEPSALAFMSHLGIEIFQTVTAPRDLALIDLPDTDSVEASHRITVDRLLPSIDLLCWVVDPEKYQDRRLEHYLARLGPYRRQLIFVMNQIDRVRVDERIDLLEDFVASLERIGIHSPRVLVTAVAPYHGPVEGLSDMGKALEEVQEGKDVAITKLLIDLDSAIEELMPYTGSTSFASRWNAFHENLEPSPEIAGQLSGLVESLAGEVDPVTSRRLSDVAESIQPVSDLAVEAAIREGSRIEMPRRWRFRLRRRRIAERAEAQRLAASEVIDERIGKELRAVLRRRAELAAAVTEFRLVRDLSADHLRSDHA